MAKFALFGKKSKPADEIPKVFQTNEEILYAIDIILESCDAISRRISGVSKAKFLSDDDKMKASGMDMQIIGNQAGRFPAEILELSEELRAAYGFRCRIAHDYGTFRFESEYLWDAVKNDVPKIRKVCVEVRGKILSGELDYY